MKFRYWLENIEDFSNSQSWLDTNGEFYPVYGMNHDSWAIKQETNIQTLFEEGWMRIIYIGDTLYACNDAKMPLNQRQKQNLADFAMFSNRFTEIVYDDGERDKIIWTHLNKM